MSNTPARPCTTTALLWQNSLWWISTPSATCLSMVAPSACGLQPLVETVVPAPRSCQAVDHVQGRAPQSSCPPNHLLGHEPDGGGVTKLVMSLAAHPFNMVVG